MMRSSGDNPPRLNEVCSRLGHRWRHTEIRCTIASTDVACLREVADVILGQAAPAPLCASPRRNPTRPYCGARLLSRAHAKDLGDLTDGRVNEETALGFTLKFSQFLRPC